MKSIIDKNDQCMNNICADLSAGLSTGYVYDMTDVFQQYMNMCAECDTPVPQCYLSRRQSFYENVQKRLGKQGSFVRPLSNTQALLLYPCDTSQFLISESLSKS